MSKRVILNTKWKDCKSSKNLCTKNFTYMKKFCSHEIAAVSLSKIYFLENARKTFKPNNRDLNRDWMKWKLVLLKSCFYQQKLFRICSYRTFSLWKNSGTQYFLFLLFFFLILNIATSCTNKISSSSESDMTLKALESSHLKFFSVNLMTEISKIITKYCQISSLIAWWEPSLRVQSFSLK